MDLNEVKKLIKLVERSQIAEIEIFEKGMKIRIAKNGKGSAHTLVPAPVVQAAPPPAPTTETAPTPETPIPVATPANILEVRSPMVGTFYRAPSPDAEPYVRVGDPVEPGTVLCIVEAMKLMNEIESEIRGKVVDIPPENAQPVEYDQVLFRIEVAPSK
jgi:acetyl-CoA carboxylase biotin carboxyl carrier protein